MQWVSFTSAGPENLIRVDRGVLDGVLEKKIC